MQEVKSKKEKWNHIIKKLETLKSKTIIATIPNHYNSYKYIKNNDIYKDFIKNLKIYHGMGYEIAQHGYSHDYPFKNIKKINIGFKRYTTEFCNVLLVPNPYRMDINFSLLFYYINNIFSISKPSYFLDFSQ